MIHKTLTAMLLLAFASAFLHTVRIKIIRQPYARQLFPCYRLVDTGSTCHLSRCREPLKNWLPRSAVSGARVVCIALGLVPALCLLERRGRRLRKLVAAADVDQLGTLQNEFALLVLLGLLLRLELRARK